MKDQIALIQSKSQQIPIVFSRRQASGVICLNFVQTQSTNVTFLISRLARPRGDLSPAHTNRVSLRLTLPVPAMRSGGSGSRFHQHPAGETLSFSRSGGRPKIRTGIRVRSMSAERICDLAWLLSGGEGGIRTRRPCYKGASY